ncbi:MAG: SpoIID/LytB domain-containing protein [Oscillospiraceae bacterium]
MKLKHLLNGIAAVLTVGMFYTFSFCMVQDVHEEDIASEYFYAENTEETVPDEELPVPTAETVSDETAAVLQAGLSSVKPKAPSQIIIPKAVPDVDELISSAPRLDADPDEITDENYDENSVLYSGFSDNELDKIFKEEDNVYEYQSASASASESRSSAKDTKQNADSEGSTASDRAPDSGNITAEDINRGYLEASPSVYSATHGESYVTEYKEEQTVEAAVLPEPDPDYSFSEVVGSGETGKSTYAEFDENGSGEIFTAKVHGKVQDFDAYELVCMIVANEMSPSFSKEALKAQAVAAYSYVKYHNVKGTVASVLVKEDIPDEVREAVASVWGQCCYYKGAVAQTVYTASTSGYTASAQNVWGGDAVPYLQSKECPFDKDYDPNYGVEKTFSESDVKARLERYLGISLSADPENWLVVTEYEDGNYAASISVDGQAVISGAVLREKVLGYGIKSASFTVSYSDGAFTFTTYGYGHGVGMSQNGANILAKQGYSYVDILKFYYEGITVE